MQYDQFLRYSKELNVLFVEDNKSFSLETKELLELFFHKVDSSENGKEAL